MAGDGTTEKNQRVGPQTGRKKGSLNLTFRYKVMVYSKTSQRSNIQIYFQRTSLMAAKTLDSQLKNRKNLFSP